MTPGAVDSARRDDAGRVGNANDGGSADHGAVAVVGSGDGRRNGGGGHDGGNGRKGGSPRQRLVGRWLFRWFIRGLLVLMLSIGGGLIWLGTETGLTYALSWTQRLLVRFDQALAFERLEGNLWHGIRLGRFEWRGANMMVKGTDLRARWSYRALLRGEVIVRRLEADSLVVQLPPGENPPDPRTDTPMPGNFGLPVSVAIDALNVKRFELWPAQDVQSRQNPDPILALSDIEARLGYRLGQYEIESLTLSSPWGHVEKAHAILDAAPPHRLKASISADGNVEQWPYLLDLEADGDLDRLPLTLKGDLAKGKADVHTVLKPLSRVPFESLNARIADVDLRRFDGNGGLPATGLDLDLNVEPLAGSADQWQGRLRVANRGAGSLADKRLPLKQLQTGLRLRLPEDSRWAQSFLKLQNLNITLPVGRLATDGPAGGRTGLRKDAVIGGHVEVWPGRPMKLPGMSLPTLLADLRVEGLDLAPMAGALPNTALNGQIKLDGQKFLVEMNQTAAQLRALLPADLQKLADNAQLRIDGTLDDSLLTLREARANLGESSLHAAGRVTVRAPHDLRFSGSLRKFDPNRWLPADLGVDSRWREGTLGADWSVNGRLMGPGQKAQLDLQLVDSSLAGQPLNGRLKARPELDAQWQPLYLDDVAVQLTYGEANQLWLEGAIGRDGDRLTARADLARLDALDQRLGGNVALDAVLKGRLADLQAEADLKATGFELQTTTADGVRQRTSLKNLHLEAQAPLQLLTPAKADTPVQASLKARQLRIDDQLIDAIDLKFDGAPRDHRLDLVVDYGKDHLRLGSRGELRQPAEGPQWHARIDRLDLSGRASVSLDEPATLMVDARQLQMGRLDMTALGGDLQMERLNLTWADSPLQYESTGRLTGIEVPRVRVLLGLEDKQDLEMVQDVRADLSWRIRGQGAEAIHGQVQTGIREEVPTGRKPRLGLREGNGLSLSIDGRQLDGQVRLDFPSIDLVNLFLGSDISVGGSLRADGTVRGSIDQPRIDLLLSGQDLSVLQRSAGMRLSGGVLNAQLSGDGLNLKELRFTSGEGSLLLKGQARLVEGAGQSSGEALASADELEAAARRRQGAASTQQPSVLPMEGRFDVTMDRFRVPVGPGQRVTVSGLTRLTSSAQGLFLDGGLKVDEGLIELQGSSAPSLPDDVHIVDATGPQDDEPGEADETEDGSLRIRSRLDVDLGNELVVNGEGVQARLSGKLQLQGFLPSSPRLTGVINVVDGSYEAYGQNLRITKGLVRFTGPLDNPSLDIEATRPYLPVEVGISVTGQVANPQVALISRTSMDDTTKLSWLVLGVPPDQAGGAAQMLALQQAGTLLLGNDGSHSPSLADRLGLDVLNYGYASDADADQGLQETLAPKGLIGRSGTDDDSTETGVVTVGKRINSRLFVSYEKGVRGVWNLLRVTYTLGRGWVVRTQAGSDNSIDVLRSRSFD